MMRTSEDPNFWNLAVLRWGAAATRTVHPAKRPSVIVLRMMRASPMFAYSIRKK